MTDFFITPIIHILTKEPLIGSIFIFMLGACVGSFLNVVIYRMPNNISVIFPRSSCPKCNYSIPLYLNIPILSWLMLRGKCKNCKTKIPFCYIGFEILCAIAFVTIYLLYRQANYNLSYLIISLLILCHLIPIFFIDLKYQIIPHKLNLSFLFIALISLIILQEDLYQYAFSYGFDSLKERFPNYKNNFFINYAFFGFAFITAFLFSFSFITEIFFKKKKTNNKDYNTIKINDEGLKINDKHINLTNLIFSKKDKLNFNVKNLFLQENSGCIHHIKQGALQFFYDKIIINEQSTQLKDISFIYFKSKNYQLNQATLGKADIIFMAIIALFTGPFAAFLICSIAAIMALICLVIIRKKTISFGCYIAMSFIFWFIYYQEIIQLLKK